MGDLGAEVEINIIWKTIKENIRAAQVMVLLRMLKNIRSEEISKIAVVKGSK